MVDKRTKRTTVSLAMLSLSTSLLTRGATAEDCSQFNVMTEISKGMNAGCVPDQISPPLSCCKKMYELSISQCFYNLFFDFAARDSVQGIMDQCDDGNGIPLRPGYDGLAPAWYFADVDDYDFSAPNYPPGMKELYDKLKNTTCKHGEDSPFKALWKDDFDLHEQYIETHCDPGVNPEKNDGPVKIYTQTFMPKSGRVEAALYVGHGLGEWTDKFHVLFRDGTLATKNWMIVMIDTRGAGTSTGFPNYFPSFNASACDMSKVMKSTLANFPGLPVFWYCHSTGCATTLAGMANPQYFSSLSIREYFMTSPYFETYTGSDVICPLAYDQVDQRTPYGYISSFSERLYPLHDDFESFHLFRTPSADLKYRACSDRGAPTIGFFLSNCAFTGDLYDPTDGLSGTDFASTYTPSVKIWGVLNDTSVLPKVSKLWCAAAPNCVYHEFGEEGLLRLNLTEYPTAPSVYGQHELMASLTLGPVVRDEMFTAMQAKISESDPTFSTSVFVGGGSDDDSSAVRSSVIFAYVVLAVSLLLSFTSY